jgi:hypothetical protein
VLQLIIPIVSYLVVVIDEVKGRLLCEGTKISVVPDFPVALGVTTGTCALIKRILNVNPVTKKHDEICSKLSYSDPTESDHERER